MVDIVAPSSVSNPNILSRQARIEEDARRTGAGLGELQGTELQQFLNQHNQQLQRQNQLEEIESVFDDRQLQAEEVANSLLEAGLGDVAERFRRGSQRSAFNFARRGLAGGSADIERQAQLQTDAGQEAEQAAAQAQQSTIQRILQAQQQRDKLAQEAIKANPFLATQEGFDLRDVKDQTGIEAAISDIERQMQQADLARDSAIGSGIGNFLGSAGQTVSGSLIGSALSNSGGAEGGA